MGCYVRIFFGAFGCVFSLFSSSLILCTCRPCHSYAVHLIDLLVIFWSPGRWTLHVNLRTAKKRICLEKDEIVFFFHEAIFQKKISETFHKKLIFIFASVPLYLDCFQKEPKGTN